MATAAPLMPKATAVWLLDNTALSFDQIAEFCKLHPLEVKAIADGDAAQGIKGLDPIVTGQLTREQIAEAEKNPESRLKLTEPKVAVDCCPRYFLRFFETLAPPWVMCSTSVCPR